MKLCLTQDCSVQVCGERDGPVREGLREGPGRHRGGKPRSF